VDLEVGQSLIAKSYRAGLALPAMRHRQGEPCPTKGPPFRGFPLSQHSEPFTIGVEEEFQIIHPESRQLRQRAGGVLHRARQAVGDEVTNELFLSQIEIGTPVCAGLAEVRAELVRLRKAVVDAARRDGCRIGAAGTHPFSDWHDQTLTPKDRYAALLSDFQQLTREQIIFGCHVHVAIADKDEAIRVMNRVRPWLAPLLALSANSPFWMGLDTGYASYRSELFGRFPMAGLPMELASRAEYDALVDALVSTESIIDASRIYWDVRPSMRFDTLEFRVADVCQSVDEAVAVAGLCRGLALACHDAPRLDAPEHRIRPELLRVSKWRAARFGLEGDLIDPWGRKTVPASRMVEALLAFVRDALESVGEWDEVSTLVREIVRRGNGATRQRRAYQVAGKFEDVVDLILEETAGGLD
jgi:glutamate---cysteine ligase / carboxylate-amine ligase